jgi:hypothetical protein
MPNDASSGPPALAGSAVYSATLVRSTCGTKYSGSALSSTMTRMSSSDSSSLSRVTRSRTSSGPIRFIGGASITTLSTPLSLRATRSVRYVWVIADSSTPATASTQRDAHHRRRVLRVFLVLLIGGERMPGAEDAPVRFAGAVSGWSATANRWWTCPAKLAARVRVLSVGHGRKGSRLTSVDGRRLVQ